MSYLLGFEHLEYRLGLLSVRMLHLDPSFTSDGLG